MLYDTNLAIDRLLDSYKAYYNIDQTSRNFDYLVASCEYHESSQKYVLSRKAQLWSEYSEEFLYLFKVDELTLDIFNKCKDFVLKDGMDKAHIGPSHMYTYITPIFVCNSCTNEAKKAIKKCRIYKSFRFSFHGWMDFHTAVFEVNDNTLTYNNAGRLMAKGIKKVLLKNK